MSCDTLDLIDAYLDGELELTQSIAVEEHLAGCGECRLKVSGRKRLAGQLGGIELRYPAPARVRRGGAGRAWPKRVGVAAAFLVGCFAAGMAGWLARAPSAHGFLAEQVVASHVRSLQVDHLVDVASSDQHTVKPWFAGKLDYAPEVKDLAERGFPLVGGRLEYLEGRPVCALVYRHGGHAINVLQWPSDRARAAGAPLEIQGYHVVRWSGEGREWWAVSDLNEGELEAFCRELSGGTGKGP